MKECNNVMSSTHDGHAMCRYLHQGQVVSGQLVRVSALYIIGIFTCTPWLYVYGIVSSLPNTELTQFEPF